MNTTCVNVKGLTVKIKQSMRGNDKARILVTCKALP